MPNETPRERLTKALLDRLAKPETVQLVWCKDLKGFGCRVQPSGKKTLFVQYRIGGRNSPTRKVTIGAYGNLTVEQARQEAVKVLANAELGNDVAAEKTKKRAEHSIAQLCDEYLKNGLANKKASTVATDQGRIERHIKKLLGHKLVSEVKRTDITRFMNDVANGKTAVAGSSVTGGKGTATRTVRLLGGIFSYAVEQGYIETNPRHGVKVFPDGKGERYLSPEELARLGETLREAETVGLPWRFNEGVKAKHRPVKAENQREIIAPPAIAAIRLLILTGCRLGEILNLRWSHVDMERGFLNLADSKTGAKVVWLGAPALEILAGIPRVGSYVIAGADPKKPRSGLKRPWERITTAAGLSGPIGKDGEPTPLRMHDLRHSFASVGAAGGLGLGTVGKLLGHASPSTTARYSHLADDPMRRAADTISATIAASMDRSRPSADVIALPKRAR